MNNYRTYLGSIQYNELQITIDPQSFYFLHTYKLIMLSQLVTQYYQT